MGFKRTEESEKILTVISGQTKITGSLLSSGPVRIDGHVEGEVDISGDIIIGENAVIKAQVKGTNIQVAGKVIGNVEAEKKLQILATGVVEGDINVAALEVADGGILTGSCLMRRTSQMSSES